MLLSLVAPGDELAKVVRLLPDDLARVITTISRMNVDELLTLLNRAEELTPEELAAIYRRLDEMTPEELADAGITADKLKELGYSDEAIEAIQRKNPCAIGATLLAKPPGLAKMLLANPCRQDRLDELAQDPAHNGKETPGSRREAEVGLSLEEAGELPGPIQRDPSGAAEFIDATGQKWDVKAFNSNFPPRKGGFKLETAMDKIRGELDAGENVILDTKNLSPAHQQQLREAIEAQGWGDRIKWANP